MEIEKNNLNKTNEYLQTLNETNTDLSYLINLVQQENNLLARDLIAYNFIEKIFNLLSSKCYKFYAWTPIEPEDLKTIAFLSIDSAIKTFNRNRNVPFDYYVKLHSLLFFVQYARQFTFKKHYVLNKCVSFENKSIEFSTESAIVDKINPTPFKYVKYQICFLEIQKKLKSLSKVEQNSLLLKLQGYTYAQITKLLKVKRKRLEYIIKSIRMSCINAGVENLIA